MQINGGISTYRKPPTRNIVWANLTWTLATWLIVGILPGECLWKPCTHWNTSRTRKKINVLFSGARFFTTQYRAWKKKRNEEKFTTRRALYGAFLREIVKTVLESDSDIRITTKESGNPMDRLRIYCWGRKRDLRWRWNSCESPKYKR